MAAELNHRVKNTLASVQSLAVHSLSGDGDPKTMREAFEARLVALSKVHNQLAENHWSWADLGTIVRDALAPFPQAAYEPLRGPQVSLAAASAVALAMVLNELATNAGRYGALATSEGRLALCWSVDERETGRVLVLDWRESGGAPVVKPMRRGFGARFVERAVQCELDGRITLDFAPEGLFCRIEAPLQTGLKAGAGPLGTPTP
jgi:two-component sensor histidine kinase